MSKPELELEAGVNEAQGFAWLIRNEVLSHVELAIKRRYTEAAARRIVDEVRAELAKLDAETVDFLIDEARKNDEPQ